MVHDDRVVTVNGGSSTVKLAVYTVSDPRRRLLKAEVTRIGAADAVLNISRADGAEPTTRSVEASDHRSAAMKLVDWLQEANGHASLKAIGHRVVHGGIHLTEHQLITPDVIAELRKSQCLDLAHLPREILLIEAFESRFPSVPQVACFDTAFHRDLHRVAQLLPIPRRYSEAGIRRLGFHGLSYTYLLAELRRIAGQDAADGRVILAHLGSGASMVAVRGGKPLDTTMAFTPAAGLMMSTRPGDLDPGLLVYLMATDKLSASDVDDLISRQCGLVGVSEGTSDVRELMARRATDPRAADALDLFCYIAKKWVGAYAAVLGGIDTLVFSGGIGEHSSAVRAGICSGLEALGIRLDERRNAAPEPIISSDESPVTVRVIPTDEEAVMASIVCSVVTNHARV